MSNTFTPPRSVQSAAKRALEVRASKPESQRGGTPVGLATARLLASGRAVSLAKVRHIAAYFPRHEVDKKGSTWDDQGKGWQAWGLWGGDAGRAWASAIVEREDKVEKSAKLTDAQKEAGNYRKKHIRFAGLAITIEHEPGAVREGTDKNGKAWRTVMKHAYGYIKGTRGVDGDHVDVFLGPNEDAKYVYVVHQARPDTGKYDEDKCMIGFGSEDDAVEAYRAHYGRPDAFFADVTALPLSVFKRSVRDLSTPEVVPGARAAVNRGETVKAMFKAIPIWRDVEIPALLGAALHAAAWFGKAAHHKYIRRVPKPGGGYRYYYRVTGGHGLGHDEEIKAGAAFRVKHGDKDGHFHVIEADGDKVRIRHDESEHETTVGRAELREMLHKEHAEAIGTAKAKAARDLAQAKKTGTPKQVAAREAEAKKLGVKTSRAPGGMDPAIAKRYEDLDAHANIPAISAHYATSPGWNDYKAALHNYDPSLLDGNRVIDFNDFALARLKAGLKARKNAEGSQQSASPKTVNVQRKSSGRDDVYEVGSTRHMPRVAGGGGPDGHYWTVMKTGYSRANEDMGQYDNMAWADVRPATESEAAPVVALNEAIEAATAARTALADRLASLKTADARVPEMSPGDRLPASENRRMTIEDPSAHGTKWNYVLTDTEFVAHHGGNYDDYRTTTYRVPLTPEIKADLEKLTADEKAARTRVDEARDKVNKAPRAKQEPAAKRAASPARAATAKPAAAAPDAGLSAYGLRAEKQGRSTYLTGNTYQYKETIKEAGGRWDRDARAWKVDAAALDRLPRLLRQSGPVRKALTFAPIPIPRRA